MEKKVSNFASRLKEGMDIRRVKQSELSKATKINKSSISNYLSGVCEPKQENLKKISEVLGINTNWLMGYDTPMNNTVNLEYNCTNTSNEVKNKYRFIDLTKFDKFNGCSNIFNEFSHFDKDLVRKPITNINCNKEFIDSSYEVSNDYIRLSKKYNLGDDYIFDYIYLPSEIMHTYTNSDFVLVLKIENETMNKVIPFKSTLIIDTSINSISDISENDIVVFEYESFSEHLLIMKFINDRENERFLFTPNSYNEKILPISIKHKDFYKIKVLGKVVKYIADLD